MRKKQLTAATYAEATIRIPIERLAKMLQPGDAVFAWGRFRRSGEKYIVTAVNWWGVWAIPDPDFIARLGPTKMDTKSHEKLKWGNVLGVDFCAEERKFPVLIRTGRCDIIHNPAVREKYPDLYAEVRAQGEFPCGYLYQLKFNAWRQYKRYSHNMSLGYLKP